VKRNVIVLLAAALTGFASLASAQAKIGVVNTDKLLSESPQYQAAQAAVSAEFAPRQLDIQKLQELLTLQDEKLRKDGATMTEMQRAQLQRDLTEGARSLKSKNEAAEEDFNMRREEVMQNLQRIMREEIGSFAKANSYDLILVSGVGYAGPAYDVTNALLEALKKKAGATATPAAKPAATAPAATKPPASTPAVKP
jgi:outer membrane protein